jgi:hypothetical protein
VVFAEQDVGGEGVQKVHEELERGLLCRVRRRRGESSG